MMSSFLAVNLYTSTSFPGFAGNKDCNYCHNQPAFAKTVDASISLSDWNAYKTFDANSLWARNEVPVIKTNNRTTIQNVAGNMTETGNLEFIAVTFLTNSTHMMFMASITDPTIGSTSSKTTSDKFAIIFNIDVVNFTVGDFLGAYNSTADEADALSGQMGFPNGHADMWYADTAVGGINTTSKLGDYNIASNYASDGTDKQDVSYAMQYGSVAHDGSLGYRVYFVRALTTSDTNDVQFTEGMGIHYAIARWDNSRWTYHYSSFDQMVVVGNELAGKMTVTEQNTVTNTNEVTVTVTGTTTPSGTTSSFTVIFVLAGLVVAIPVIANMRKRKE
jgi:hypothetical protein